MFFFFYFCLEIETIETETDNKENAENEENALLFDRLEKLIDLKLIKQKEFIWNNVKNVINNGRNVFPFAVYSICLVTW